MPSRCKRRSPAIALAASLLALASPALADQFKESADGGTVACSVSARELTRFALIGDQFASVSKISSGYPYNDFAVTHEPVRGDIYVSVPETFAANRISFFATTKAGYVYKFSCSIDKIEAAQVFITNSAIAKGDAGRWERQTGQDEAAVRLVQAHQASRFSTRYKVATGSNAPRTLPKRGFDPLRFHQENQTLNLLFCSFCQISIAYVQADADGCLAKVPVIKAAAYELPMRLPPKTVPR